MVCPFRLAQRLLALLIITLVISAEPAAASVFDADDRVTLSEDRSDLAGIGVISETETSSYGTAFLIGACHALSAKHVVHLDAVVGRKLLLRFKPWQRPDESNSSRATVIASGGAAAFAGDVSQDWILLRLDRCLGRSLGFVPLSERATRSMLIGVGFPRDRSDSRRPTIDPSCRVRQVTEYGLLHDCATMPRNSGGPMMTWNASRNRFEAVAIDVAGVGDNRPRAFDLLTPNAAVSIAAIRAMIEAIERPAATPSGRTAR